MKKIALLSAALVFLPVLADDAATTSTDDELVCHNGFYFGLGVDLEDSGERNDFKYAPGSGDSETFLREVDGHSTRIGGSLLLGFGRKIPGKPIYLGIEAGLDAKRCSVYSQANNTANGVRYFDILAKRNGLVPSLALRIGHYHADTGVLTFLKVGVSYAKSSSEYTEWDIDAAGLDKVTVRNYCECTSYSPLVALGLEKAFTRCCSARVEAEYRLGKNKTKAFTGHGGDHGAANKLYQKDSVNIRALVCYNVKVF
ncbi:MAG: hypothetical protein LBD81_00935 [Holosporaceae bacterium]|nr:hypothetical protein [Holosporaceae bacterium]